MPFYAQTKKSTQSLEDLFESPAASQQIQEWQANPFRPHVIARLRLVTGRALILSSKESLLQRSSNPTVWLSIAILSKAKLKCVEFRPLHLVGVVQVWG